MSEGMTALRSRMQEADEVKIIGPATQLTFSLKGIDAVACGGTIISPMERFSPVSKRQC